MQPIARILVPTDFSALATAALQRACDFATLYHARLHVIHVVSPARELPVAVAVPLGTDSSGFVTAETAERVLQSRHDQLCDYVRTHVPACGIGADCVVRLGAPAQEIARYAREAAIDMIVIGTHAKGMLKRILLGSTSEAVLEHCACPVLMVPISAE